MSNTLFVLALSFFMVGSATVAHYGIPAPAPAALFYILGTLFAFAGGFLKDRER